jgi:hypothetical protein
MRMRLTALIGAALLCTSGAESQTFTAAQAREHDGEKVTICGTVTNEYLAAASKGKPTFIDLDSSYPNTVFVVVIWDQDRQQIGALPAVKDHLCATGVVSYFHGIPQIIARQRGQLSH